MKIREMSESNQTIPKVSMCTQRINNKSNLKW